MTHNEVLMKFISWYQSKNPEARLFKNHSGFASKEKVHYGIPSGGGGFDLFDFEPGAVTKFFEVKTIAYPTLSAKQKNFAKNMAGMGFECFVVKEIEVEPFFYVIPAHLYRPYKAWPY